MTYKWKYLFIKQYRTTAEFESLEFALDEADFTFFKPFINKELYSMLIKFKSEYTHFAISKESKKALDYFVDQFQAKDLYHLAAAFQFNYINAFSNRGELENIWEEVKDFRTESESFLEMVEKYLNGEPSSEMKLKIKAYNKTFDFKNFLIINEWIDSFVKLHSLTSSNFFEFKEKTLSNINSIQLPKYPEYLVQNYIQSIHEFIASRNPNLNINSKIKYTAFFLLACQIPINSQAEDITNPSSIKDLEDSDVKNTRNYLNGLKALSVK